MEGERIPGAPPELPLERGILSPVVVVADTWDDAVNFFHKFLMFGCNVFRPRKPLCRANFLMNNKVERLNYFKNKMKQLVYVKNFDSNKRYTYLH